MITETQEEKKGSGSLDMGRDLVLIDKITEITWAGFRSGKTAVSEMIMQDQISSCTI